MGQNTLRIRIRLAKALLFAACMASLSGALAEDAGTLDEIVVSVRKNDLIGEASSATEGVVTARQLENRPLLRPAEVLEEIPGLIISQHSGDGKANQYYLRGFNLDHGTDFATSVMGMPVNMPSHAHGQGYSDLQFLIPELIDRIQYRKGPYAAADGDFATAGSASIDYVRRLPASFMQGSAGQNGYRRALLAGSPADGNLLYALELTGNNGPWQSPENLGKINGMLRYGEGDRHNGWSVAAMSYAGRWNSTDQVPLDAIASGLISRFGSLDPTDGGDTRRSSLSTEWSVRENDRWTRANAYVIDYSLDLWSNFTYCMNDIALNGNCNRGDQFQQSDRRKVYGADAANTWYANLNGKDTEFTLGFQSRYDSIDNGLLLTTARTPWAAIRQDHINEGSLGFYGENQTQWSEKFRSIEGLRADIYSFDVSSSLAQNSGRVNAHIASPKLALIFGPWNRTEYYFNLGYGFHSNDARGTTTRVNPDFRNAAGYLQPVSPVTPLVKAKGGELGLRSSVVPNLQTTFALWQLDLASELVFSGDAGTTLASYPSRRTGIEWSNHWTPQAHLDVDADAAISRARYSTFDPAAGNYIPGAIEKTLSLAASYDSRSDWSGGVRLRYFGPRPLVANNAVRSASSTLVNLQAGYRVSPRAKLTFDVLNLFDRQVSDIDYYYATQLRNQALPVNGIVTHPAEPRALRVTLRIDL